MRSRSRAIFWLSALGIGAFEVMGTFGATSNQPERKDVTALALALVVVGPAALAVRDRYPRAVAAAAIGSTLVYLALGYAYGPVFVSIVVALVWLVLVGQRTEAWVLSALGYVGFIVADRIDDQPGDSTWIHWALVAGWLVVVLVVADQARIRRDQRAAVAHAERESRERQAGAQRLTLAQELHDVLAHNISLVNVQASVALHLLDEQPEQARPALTAIKQASHEALEELRAALDLLRDGDAAPRTPAPRLRDLVQLVEGVRGGGLDVRLDQEPEPADVPGAVQLAAYRIVQEALTNVTRHARAAAATVAVRYAGGVTIEVVDDGIGGTPVPGNGLEGMRERAAALGGTVEAGPAVGGGFRVHAHLPVRPVIRVALADDQALVRAGFRSLLDAQPDIDVVGEAADGEEAVRLAVSDRPDVILMDIRMPGLDGLEATRRIVADERCADVRVVILTTFDLDEYVFEAIRDGANGFLVKDTEPEELIRAVRAVVAGDALLSPRVTRRLIAEFADRAKAPAAGPGLDVLTDREREVVALVGEGLSNEEIAERLIMSAATAKTHVSRAMIKLGARDRAQLVVFAYESGLVRPGWTS